MNVRNLLLLSVLSAASACGGASTANRPAEPAEESAPVESSMETSPEPAVGDAAAE